MYSGVPQEKQATGCMQAQEQCMNIWQEVFFEMLHRQHGVHAAADSADAAVERYKQRRDELSKTTLESKPPHEVLEGLKLGNPTCRGRRDLAAETLEALRGDEDISQCDGGVYAITPEGSAADHPLCVAVEVDGGGIVDVKDVSLL